MNPKMVMLDFERAAINALKITFPEAQIQGCFFHLCQCIYRSIQNNGLQTNYSDDPQFALHMRCLAALAFVPEEDVVEAFDALKNIEFFKKKLNGKSTIDIAVKNVLLYMESTWIGFKQRRAYKTGLFELNLWNVYKLTLSLLPRTNNAVEAWHNAINLLFGINHPDIFKFLDGIKLEQNATEVLIGQVMSGVDVAKSNKHTDEMQERILKVVKTYKTGGNLQGYLLGVAQSLHFVQ